MNHSSTATTAAAQDWLSQLAPAHAPPPPGWWPLAPGWWGLAALLLVVLALTALLIALYRRPSRRMRRLALRELRRLETHSGDDIALARELEDLLRRYALARYGREAVARLSGTHWIRFLVAHGGAAFDGKAGDGLLRAAYGGRPQVDRSAWLRGARDFVRARR